MPFSPSGRHTVRLVSLLTLTVLACGAVLVAHAGIRSPGKYCGVVVFDRWDTCFLLSGHFITYISSAVKEGLRPYQGKAIQVDASDVFQPTNPGDALIRHFKIIGLAPDKRRWATLEGLELIASSDFGSRGSPSLVLEIRNTSNSPIDVNGHEFGPTLLTQIPKSQFMASDGDSIAVITRGDLVNPSSWKSTVGGVAHSYSYTIEAKTRLPEKFRLGPAQSVKTRITFAVSPGQYQFVLGYGGGVHEEKSLASNAVSFVVSDVGTAILAE